MHFKWFPDSPRNMGEYLVSEVIGLTNSPNSSDLTKCDGFRYYLCQNDEKAG